MKLSSFEIKTLLVTLCFLALGYFLDKSQKQELTDTKEKVKTNFTKAPFNASNLDFETGKWETYDRWDFNGPIIPYSKPVPTKSPTINETLSDEEIRIIREKQSFNSDGSYIYTPGRNIPSYEELHEEAIEKYIDKHGDELYEELRDKYGN